MKTDGSEGRLNLRSCQDFCPDHEFSHNSDSPSPLTSMKLQTLPALSVFLFCACVGSSSTPLPATGPDAAEFTVDASIPVSDSSPPFEPECSSAPFVTASELVGASPHGALSHHFERIDFANGCGSMSAVIRFVSADPEEDSLLFKFPLPNLQFPEEQFQYSQPGTYDVTLTVYQCPADDSACSQEPDVEAAVEIRALVNGPTQDLNTDISLELPPDQWTTETITISGTSCSWTWNPC